jgi:hypothetical protein
MRDSSAVAMTFSKYLPTKPQKQVADCGRSLNIDGQGIDLPFSIKFSRN